MFNSATITANTEFVTVGEVHYAYRRFGNAAGTPLVCLQHFTGTLDLWDPAVFDRLSESREVILFENAGVARSTGSTPDTIASMTEATISFLNELNLTQVDLLGFSLGGFLAQRIALKRPDLVRRLILSGTGPEGGIGTSMNDPKLLPIFGDTQMSMTDKLKLLFFPDNEAAQEAAAAYFARIGQRAMDHDTVASGEVAMQQLKAMAAWEANKGETFSALNRITHPVLVTNGDTDIMIPTSNSFTLKQHLPNATLIVYPNAGHGALYQYPDQYVAHVSSFLEQ